MHGTNLTENWRLAERVFYNQVCKEISTWSQIRICAPMDTEDKGDYTNHILDTIALRSDISWFKNQ